MSQKIHPIRLCSTRATISAPTVPNESAATANTTPPQALSP